MFGIETPSELLPFCDSFVLKPAAEMQSFDVSWLALAICRNGGVANELRSNGAHVTSL